MHNIREDSESLMSSVLSRRRHKSLPFGVSQRDLDRARYTSDLPTRRYKKQMPSHGAFNFGVYSNRNTSYPSSGTSRFSIGDDDYLRSYGKTRVRDSYAYERPTYSSFLGTSNYTGYERSYPGRISSYAYEKSKYSLGLGLSSLQRNSEIRGNEKGSFSHMASASTLGMDRSRDFLRNRLSNQEYFPTVPSSSLYPASTRDYSENQSSLSPYVARRSRYSSAAVSSDYGSHVDLIASLQLRSSLSDARGTTPDLADSIERRHQLPLESGAVSLSKADLEISLNDQLGSSREIMNVSTKQ